jgi:hypothetical protein
MVKRFAEVLCPAAGTHMESMRNKTGLKDIPGHAAYVAGFAASLEAVKQHHLPDGRFMWPLRLDENLCVLVRADELVLYGKPRKLVLAGPEIGENSGNVRILEEWLKYPHAATVLLSQKKSCADKQATELCTFRFQATEVLATSVA